MKQLMYHGQNKSEERNRAKVPVPEKRVRHSNSQFDEEIPANFDSELTNRENEPAIVAHTLR